jgi:hypothetical protein
MSKIGGDGQGARSGVGSPDEYQALKSAAEAVEEDRELVELRGELEKLESELVSVCAVARSRTTERRSATSPSPRTSRRDPSTRSSSPPRRTSTSGLQRVNETISEGYPGGGREPDHPSLTDQGHSTESRDMPSLKVFKRRLQDHRPRHPGPGPVARASQRDHHGRIPGDGGAGALFHLDRVRWAGLLILLGGVLDIFDGQVARTRAGSPPSSGRSTTRRSTGSARSSSFWASSPCTTSTDGSSPTSGWST